MDVVHFFVASLTTNVIPCPIRINGINSTQNPSLSNLQKQKTFLTDIKEVIYIVNRIVYLLEVI